MKPAFPRIAWMITMLAMLASAAHAQQDDVPKSVPVSRHDMLIALDALKYREPRLPLPPSELDAVTEGAADNPNGRLGVVNNGRMRALYLPRELNQRRGSQAGSPTHPQLPYEFATELFWIVSRVNNCQYCLGHQENKLRSVGVPEARLLALDTDWSGFAAPHRAAFAFARQLTHAPHTVGDPEIDLLRAHYSDDEILQITFLVGRYNSTNRWTDSLGIPQEEHRSFHSELQPPELSKSSRVAVNGFMERPALPDVAAWLAELEKQSSRTLRLVPSENPVTDPSVEPHESLLASIPVAGEAWVEQLRQARLAGVLPVTLRDKIGFVAAREDHAWYMQHQLRKRLLAAGMSDEAIFALGKPGLDPAAATANQAELAALHFVTNLTADPQGITDDAVQRLGRYYSSQQIAEIVYHTGLAAVLNRLTEIAGLGFADR